MKDFFSASLFVILSQSLIGQAASTDTTAENKLNEVVITATRSALPADKLPIPVTVIDGLRMARSGQLRLADALTEMNGAQVTDNFGRGLQLRGLDPAYTLILLDGQPLIGRNGGTYDLSKIPTSMIERVEVLRGPASALYGNEALAGVVNIITKKTSNATGFDAEASAGSFGMRTGNISLYTGSPAWSHRYFINHLQSQGYDLDKASMYSSAGENSNVTVGGTTNWKAARTLNLSITGRAYAETVTNRDRFTVENTLHDFDMRDVTRELSLTPGAEKKLGSNYSLKATHHFAAYSYLSQLRFTEDKTLYYNDNFNHYFNRSEVLLNQLNAEQFQLTAGAGFTPEVLVTNRYEGRKALSTAHAFVQEQLWTVNRLNLIAGIRADYSSVYGTQWSPKIAGSYALNERYKVSASWGRGYKAPDFRQLYLSFNNNLIGYSVFGSEELETRLQWLEQNGQLLSRIPTAAPSGRLVPESANSVELSVYSSHHRAFQWRLSGYRNDISHLIETAPVAQKTNGQFVYSYINLLRVYTQGLEAEAKWQAASNLQCSAALAWLDARDKQVMRDVKEGKVYSRDPVTLESFAISPSQYGGLFNRSRWSSNIKFDYQHPASGMGATLRAIYRGRYGTADRNGNGVLDTDAEYARGYVLINASLSWQWHSQWTVLLAANNLLNHTDAQNLPSLPGANWMATIRFNTQKQTTTNNSNQTQ